MEQLKRYFQRDALARRLGMELAEVSPGRAVTRMQIGQEHFNIFGTAHGGVVFALGDYAFEAACNSHGTVAIALNARILFVKAAGAGPLTAEAVETSCGGKIGTYDIRVSDESGELVALFQGMAYRKRDPIDWNACVRLSRRPKERTRQTRPTHPPCPCECRERPGSPPTPRSPAPRPAVSA